MAAPPVLWQDPNLIPPRLQGGPPAPAAGAQVDPVQMAFVSGRWPANQGPLHAGRLHYQEDNPLTPLAAPSIHCNERRILRGPADRGCAGGVGMPALNFLTFHQTRKTCIWLGGPAAHDANHTVCEYCIDQIANQRWYRLIKRHLSRPPQVIVPDRQQPINIWQQFQTQLCRLCEKTELGRLAFRFNAMGAGGAIPVVGAADAPPPGSPLAGHEHPWPYITCRCATDLSSNRPPLGDLCTAHRWASVGAAHNRRLIIRQQNDQWLRKIGRTGGNANKLTRIDGHRRRSRELRSVFRACRCGAEIHWDMKLLDVTQCLGCEGVFHQWALIPALARYAANPIVNPFPAGLQNIINAIDVDWYTGARSMARFDLTLRRPFD